MNRFGVLLSSCAILFFPAAASAQNATLEICNNAKITVNVAYAARMQLFITGYKWQTSGWYTVDAGECKVVYDEDYDDAGPYTPQSGARVAFVSILNGTWRAYQTNVTRKTGWMQSGTGQICVRIGQDNGFKYEEPAGDPAANCGDGTLIPVAQDFLPEGPGKFTYTMDWDGVVSSVVIAKAKPSSTVASTKSADIPVDSGNSESAKFLRMLEQEQRDSVAREASKSSLASTSAKDRAALLGWVREDIAAYLESSKTGFDAYKGAELPPSPGFADKRVWKSSVQPALAQACYVVQSTAARTFTCLIPESTLNAARAYYTQITDDVSASLPAGWSAVTEAPFTGDLPSRSYRSSADAHSEFWIAPAPTGNAYELHFQLVVAAPVLTERPKADDDDPIGEGGFITPPAPPAPPPQ